MVSVDVSKNRLIQIDQLGFLTNLQKVDVSGNRISGVQQVKALSPLKFLRFVRFKLAVNLLGEENPIVQTNEYAQACKRFLTI